MKTVRSDHSEIWNWGGTRINPSIREELKIGNIVRILVQCDTLYPSGYKWYFRIVKVCNKDKGCFVGIK